MKKTSCQMTLRRLLLMMLIVCHTAVLAHEITHIQAPLLEHCQYCIQADDFGFCPSPVGQHASIDHPEPLISGLEYRHPATCTNTSDQPRAPPHSSE